MAKKTFYININKQSFNNVQALNKESSSKSFIRTLLKNKGEIKITDNNSRLSTTFVKEPIQAGRLLNTPEFFLKNKFNKDLRLKTSIGEKQFNKPLINKYKKTFESSIKIRNFNKKEPAIILESVKGGFYVYYAGVCGFLPQSQYWLVWRSMLKTNSKKDILEMLNLKRVFPIRLPLKITKLTTYPANKQNNFAKSKRLKNFENSINAVFIFKNINFEKNGEKKSKETSIQFNNRSKNKKN